MKTETQPNLICYVDNVSFLTGFLCMCLKKVLNLHITQFEGKKNLSCRTWRVYEDMKGFFSNTLQYINNH